MRLLHFISFLLFYVKEVAISNLRVAYDVLTPTMYMKPAFFAIELDELTDLQIANLANLITMTPGTLSVDVSEDRKRLYIHAMYAEPLDELKGDLKEGYEARIKKVF
ncbi:MAG: Na+/H+ antiporter subunit E [Opitutales bacterium]